MKDKKKIVIGTLCGLIMIMAVGYALLSQQLSINGTANITSTWKIEITNITEKEKHGGVTEKSKSYDAMTANFNVGFTSPGDYIIYEVEVTNSGTLDAVIERINVVTNDNPAIIYTTSGIKRGDVIEHNSKKYLTVKIEYDSSITSQPQTNNNALTVQLFTAQNLGQVQPEYGTYSVGDKITFAGSDWYVIKNSTSSEDYVTLLKENVLTHSELENYAITKDGTDYNTTPYYFSSTCHSTYTIGGTAYIYDGSGCTNHSEYEGSKVKEFLEGTYINVLGESKLKEIDGYKIRLITLYELLDDFGCTWPGGNLKYYNITPNTPTWIYQNYGEGQNGVNGYWTMTSTAASVFGNNTCTFAVQNYNSSVTMNDVYKSLAVRPVINLLKSAIE